jgi:uncharacterized SAM-binding protein YcdF (DUF218 family)
LCLRAFVVNLLSNVQRVRRYCRGCLVLAAGLVLALVVALAAFAWGAGRFLTVDGTLAPADAIVVLGGGVPGRAHHAVDLFSQGYAPLVVFSGGTLENTGLACSSAQLSLEAAQALGLPPGAALLAPEAQSTYDEAVNLQQMAGERGWQRLIVVTDPFHTRRAARTFRSLLPGVAISISAAPNPTCDPTRWWSSEDGLVTVVNESLKLGFYWLKYGISPF